MLTVNRCRMTYVWKHRDKWATYEAFLLPNLCCFAPVRLLRIHFKQRMSIRGKPRPLQRGVSPIGSESVNQPAGSFISYNLVMNMFYIFLNLLFF